MSGRSLTYELDVRGVTAGALRVVQFSVRESLFDGFRAVVDAASAETVDVEAMLGKAASLTIVAGDGTSRPFYGVVLAASVDAARADAFRVRVELGARLELLKLGRNSRIFQHLSVKDVVEAVLKEAGLRGDAQAWQTSGTYREREYVVQYDESDFAFVTRLCMEEGIGFAVRNGESAEQVIFFDDDGAFVPIDGVATLLDRDTTQLSEDVVMDLRDAASATSDAAMLRDYDYKRPGLDLSAKDRAAGNSVREVYVHPGGFLELAAGKKRVKRLLERLRVGARTMRGRSDCFRLEPGRTFTVESHPRASMNVEHLAVEVLHLGHTRTDHAGFEVEYSAEFVSMPKAVPYHPSVAAPRPVVGGLHVGFVTAPGGEEIHTDNFGRVKVRFPWDRSGKTDDQSSTWLRVGQFALGGSMVLPRQGFEVLVDYELGDVDRPFVAGHAYNGQAMPPYALPAGNSRCSVQSATTSGGPGANELRMEDAAGSEEIFLNASKDLTVSVENDATWTVKVDETSSVGSNNVLSVGADYTASVAASRTLSVGANQNINVSGDYSDGVGGSESVTVGGMRHVQTGGDHVENVKGNLSRTVGSLQAVTVVGAYTREVVGSSTTDVGAAMLLMTPKNIGSTVAGSRTETIGALKFIKAKSMSVSCGAALEVNCVAESVTCGGGRTDGAKGAVAVVAGGGMTVEAVNITIEADNKLTIVAGGCTIKLVKSGEIKIKASTVDLTGVKTLNQGTHKSG